MGLFGSIGNFFSGAVKTVAKTVTSPTKLATAVATGGLSVVAPKITAPVSQAIGQTLYNPQLLGPVLGVATGNPAAALGGNVDLSTLLGGANASTALRSVTSAITPSLGGLVNLATTAAAALQPRTAPSAPLQTSQAGMLAPTTAAGAAAMRSMKSVGRSFFNKYPNLAAGLQALYNRGFSKVTRASLWSLLKRFGPELLITGGILSAAAVSELMMSGPGRRRMNPANGRALRRSLRRLESFERLCHRVDRSLHCRRGGRRKSAGSSRSTTLIRQG